MNASHLLKLLTRWGVKCEVKAGRLVAGTRGATADVKKLVRAHRAELIEALEGRDCVIAALRRVSLVVEFRPGERFVSIPRGYRGTDVVGVLHQEAERRVMAEYVKPVPRNRHDEEVLQKSRYDE